MQASPKLRHVMPSDSCCNCGTRLGLTPLPMRYDLRANGLFDAEYWNLVIRAPFCTACAGSSRRRPLRFAEKFLLGFAGFILVVIATPTLPADLGGDNPLVRLGLAIAIGFGLPFLAPRWLPKQRDQASFWRPVQVTVPRAEVVNGMIESLQFEFASEAYARSFALANARAISSGAIKSRHRAS